MIVIAGDLLRLINIRAREQSALVGSTEAEIDFALDGQAMRTAAWLGHVGAKSRLFAKVGAAEQSSLTTAIAARGIESALCPTLQASTGVLATISDPAAPVQRYVSLGASATLVAEDLAPELFAQARWLHVSGYLFFDSRTRAAAQLLVEQAKAHGLGVSVDPGSVAQLRAVTAAAFVEWTRGVDLVLPNLDETRVLVGASGPFIDFEALSDLYPHAAVKLGSMGAAYVGALGREQLAAPRVDVHDHRGAGDAFAAGFLASWVNKAEPKAALTQGNSVAQTCLMKSGALP